MRCRRLLALALLARGARGADPAADRVLALPGWSDAFRSARFAGFLRGASASRRLAYFFAESEGDPAADPVVLWLNGGPGCSSFIGLFLENGPLSVGGDGALAENAGRWNARANVLYLESPPGVGFSYDAAAPPPYAANDTSTAADSLAALRDFFASFPAFAGRDLWLTGESYAGVYVPFLASGALHAAPSPAAVTRTRAPRTGAGRPATGSDAHGHAAALAKTPRCTTSSACTSATLSSARSCARTAARTTTPPKASTVSATPRSLGDLTGDSPEATSPERE